MGSIDVFDVPVWLPAPSLEEVWAMRGDRMSAHFLLVSVTL
jgi:hypothetical protein